MRKKTKPYITLIDRFFKGKEWFTSWKSYKNIRRLTEIEAIPLGDTIQEVILPKYKKDVFKTDNGRMICNECGSKNGFYVKKRPFGKAINVYTCVNCGIREVINL